MIECTREQLSFGSIVRCSGFPEQQSSIVKWIGCGLKAIDSSSAARKRLRARSIGDPMLFMLPSMSD
jgi:hypothetical protein